ncbi:hypothetical protein ACWDRR_26820 [Kitasatospora sp. NPDC003701]
MPLITDPDRDEPEHGLSAWPVERLQEFVPAAHDSRRLEAARVVAQQHAYDSGLPPEVRRRWAGLSLLANRRMRGDHPDDSTRGATQDFMLRTWVVHHLGPDHRDPRWTPETLAADTLATLTLSPSDAGALADNWRGLPAAQIRELRRHRSRTAHLDDLVGHLRPGPLRDRLLRWCETRRLLP